MNSFVRLFLSLFFFILLPNPNKPATHAAQVAIQHLQNMISLAQQTYKAHEQLVKEVNEFLIQLPSISEPSFRTRKRTQGM